MVVQNNGEHPTLIIAGAVLSAIAIAAVFARFDVNNGDAPTMARYLSDGSGNALHPAVFNEWKLVRSLLIPKALKRHPWLSH